MSFVLCICEGCKIKGSTTNHILKCKSLIGGNDVVTYLPNYKYLHGEDNNELVGGGGTTN